MSLKHTLRETADNVADDAKKAAEEIKRDGEKLANKVKHTIGAATHHGAAESEYAKRQALGDQMTPKERAESVAAEAKHRVEAEIDEVKKDLDDV